MTSGREHTRHEAAPSGFNEGTQQVEITPEQLLIGRQTKDIFDSSIKRTVPWLIKNGRITVDDNKGLPTLVLNRDPKDKLRKFEIPVENLSNETISPVLASVMFTFKRIEDKLADFSETAANPDLFRNYWGISNSYYQWSYEENQHSDALGLILERTGHLSRAEAQEDYYTNLAQTWEAPFPGSPRKMVLYAAFQEQLTSLNYRALAKRAIEEGALTVRDIMILIARDEAYHGGGYRAFSKIFAHLDLEGTIADAVDVAKNFRMPAQHLMRDRRRNSVEIIRVGAFSKEMVSEETIYNVLRGLEFVPEETARQTANNYWATN